MMILIREIFYRLMQARTTSAGLAALIALITTRFGHQVDETGIAELIGMMIGVASVIANFLMRDAAPVRPSDEDEN
jgi:hypothetical protein